MDRLRRVLRRESSYEPLVDGLERPDGQTLGDASLVPFSWIDYSVFLMLGVAMLWAWNMFLAAGPYFQHRFQADDWLSTHFQSSELSVSTIASLGSLLVLTKLQSKASYPKRIISALVINLVTFTLLALFTRPFLYITPRSYFGFLMVMVLASSLATGLCQNGVFAYVSGFGRKEYTQAIMTGQAVAGVLPCIAQIVSVLSVAPRDAEDGAAHEPSTSAFAYFLTATCVCAITLVAFFYLLSRHRHRSAIKRLVDGRDDGEEERTQRKPVGLLTLFKKLSWLAGAVFLCFVVTMVYPVFTQEIQSVRPPDTAQRIFQPASFIPLAFLFWNSGDLIGRVITAVPPLSSTSHPRLLFIFSIVRIVFIPLYLLCNINGHGAKIKSDTFYLVFVQLLFGITNGYIGSTCMMGAPGWVDAQAREAAGGFMSLMLIAGLTVGSLLSFLVVSK